MSGLKNLFSKKPSRSSRNGQDQRFGKHEEARASMRYSKVNPNVTQNSRQFLAQDEHYDTYENFSRDLNRDLDRSVNDSRWGHQFKEKITSEYGSAEPSPTQRAPKVIFDADSSADSSEYESEPDTEAVMMEFYENKYRDQIRHLKRELKRSKKEMMFYYKFYKEYEKVSHKYEMAKKEVYHLRHVASQLELQNQRMSMRMLPESYGSLQRPMEQSNHNGRLGAREQLCSLEMCSTSGQEMSREASTIAMNELDEVKDFRIHGDEDQIEMSRDASHSNLVSDNYNVDCNSLLGVPAVIPEKDEVKDESWEEEANNNVDEEVEIGIRHSISDSALYQPEVSFKEERRASQYRGTMRPMRRNRVYDGYSTTSDDEKVTTSDDERKNRELIERQLKKRGMQYRNWYNAEEKKKYECLQYKGRRKDIRSSNKIYSRFGNPEREAMKQFEYLQDMSTDVSGFMSTPDRSPAYR